MLRNTKNTPSSFTEFTGPSYRDLTDPEKKNAGATWIAAPAYIQSPSIDAGSINS